MKIGFDKILVGTNKNWGKWSDVVAVILPGIIYCEMKLENILPMRPIEWLVILVGSKTFGTEETEARKSKKVTGWCSL